MALRLPCPAFVAALLLALQLLPVGCGQGPAAGSDATAGTDATPPPPDGVCPGAPTELVVTRTDDELDSPAPASVADAGGAGDLSLREAMAIANTIGGGVVIRFASEVFPPEAPATIFVESEGLPPLAANGTCIDGSGAGVIVSGAALDPASAEPGFVIASMGNVLAELAIVSFPGDGVRLTGTEGCYNLITACDIGVVGTVPAGNAGAGIAFHAAATLNQVVDVTIGANGGDGIRFAEASANSNTVVSSHLGVDGAWTTPLGNGGAGVAVADSPQGDFSPFISAAGLHVWFDSGRAGGLGGNDIYRASRLSVMLPFDPPIAITELNSPDPDNDPWVSDDLRYIVFASERSGNAELYEAMR